MEKQLKYSNLFHFLKSEEKKTRPGGDHIPITHRAHSGYYILTIQCETYCDAFFFVLFSAGSLSVKNIGKALFEYSLKTVFTRNQTNKTITFNSTSLLREASCLGNHRASLLLATIHLSGLGSSVDQQQVRFLCLDGLSVWFLWLIVVESAEINVKATEEVVF